MQDQADILIAGGGIAGLTAAVVFARAGFSVICADPAPPVQSPDADGADLRSTAFLQPARDLFEETGLWARLSGFATPLEVMRIAELDDATGGLRLARGFDSAEFSERPFGWNLPNWRLRAVLAEAAGEAGVDFRAGLACRTLFTRSGGASVTLSDGARVAARLVIAADGRDSPMRAAAGIAAHTIRYGQKALAFAVTHDLAHGNISTEIHASGGPFTLVPLPDLDGRSSSAVVWMDHAANAQRLASLATDAFETEMTARSGGVLGQLRLATRRSLWPIVARHAQRLAGERLALVAEAAHVVPPIGAQGLNMSLTDIRTLRDLAVADAPGLGDAGMLDAYHAARIGDIRMRIAGIDLLNRASRAGGQPVRDIRSAGIAALHGVPPVRRALMRLGLGV